MSKKDYRKLKGQVGIYKHHSTKNYLAMKKVDGKVHQKTFSSLYEEKSGTSLLKEKKLLKNQAVLL